MSMSDLNDLSKIYHQEVFTPQLGKKKPAEGGAKTVEKGKTDSESSAKRIRQATYDIRYRSRREDVPADKAFNQYMSNTTMTAPEKKAVKDKLNMSYEPEGDDLEEERDASGKYKVRVKDKTSGKSYVRYATREKINQLRSNPNISSVEMTGYGEPYEGSRKKKSGKLDPVGQEDKDIDNDGDHDKTDKYLLNRRKVRGKAIETRKEEFVNEVTKMGVHYPHEVPDRNLKGLVAKAVKRIDTDVDGDVERNDKTKGEMGEFIPSPDGKKRVYSKVVSKEETYSWREGLILEVDDEDREKEIKEKKVKNKVVINPEMKTEEIQSATESFAESVGADVELDELDEAQMSPEEQKQLSAKKRMMQKKLMLQKQVMQQQKQGKLPLNYSEENEVEEDFDLDLIDEMFYETLEEGHDVDEAVDIVQKSYEMILDEDYYDSAVKTSKAAAAKINLKKRKTVSDRLSSLKQKVKSGAKKAITGAAYAAGKAMKAKETVPQKTTNKVRSLVDRVKTAAQSGYKAGKGPESPSSAHTKTRSSSTYRGAGAGRKEKIGEEVDQVDEKLNMKKEKMGDVIKDFYKSDAPQFKGKSKEKRREMAIAAKLTAERGGRKLGEETIDERTRYAKETGKDPQTGKPSVKGGNEPPAAMKHLQKSFRDSGGMMSSRKKPIQPQGKKKVPGAKPPKGVTPVDRIKGQLARKRAPKPDIGSRFD